ncbi:MAG: alpha/beta hydrolase [Desulfobacterota bacterium]|jgi:pimeloyl-ACP methyl ester carboxylesterase|nr:alpha/beta hydrolase [Thermodesulfobacteriota bacterium]
MENYGLPADVGFKTGEKGIFPDRPTLVLIHGAGSSSQAFLNQLRRLDRTINVLALDLPGHGGTSGPGRDTISGYANWVEEVFSSFLVKSFYLGGHSMGGAIAQELALRSWPRIRGLILIATGAELRVSTKIIEGLAKEPEPTRALINKWCFPPDADPLLLRQSLELLKQTPVQIIYNDFQACNRFDRSENVGTITLPTLILVGEQDVMTPPAFAEDLQKQILNSKLVQVPGAGHLVMLEKPREVNQAMEDFVSVQSQ